MSCPRCFSHPLSADYELLPESYVVLMFSLASQEPPMVDLGMNILLAGMEQGVDTTPVRSWMSDTWMSNAWTSNAWMSQTWMRSTLSNTWTSKTCHGGLLTQTRMSHNQSQVLSLTQQVCQIEALSLVKCFDPSVCFPLLAFDFCFPCCEIYVVRL